jgi:hypothetical protein
MYIGQEFTHPHTGHVHRVTDVGRRTFLTINTTFGSIDTYDRTTRETTTRLVAGAEWQTWLTGPPYTCAEQVWDEDDQEALRDINGIEWIEASPIDQVTASANIKL